MVERWRQSGLSMRAFAEAEGVAAHCVWYWKKRLGSDGSTVRSTNDFVVLTPSDIESSEVSDTDDDMAVETSKVDDAVEVVLENGELVRIPRGTATLAQILRAVRTSHR